MRPALTTGEGVPQGHSSRLQWRDAAPHTSGAPSRRFDKCGIDVVAIQLAASRQETVRMIHSHAYPGPNDFVNTRRRKAERF